MAPETWTQIIVFGTLLVTLAFFVVGRWRFDLVALLALLVVSVSGVVPAAQAFAGFGHPAVVTVAGVLVVSEGLRSSGVVDLIARWMARVGDHPVLQVTVLTTLVAALSSFMNNVGALALLMPVAIQMAHRSSHPPSLFLMPIAFGSLLGGTVTLIGTPPNIIIATLRTGTGAPPFRMFDFTPVGLGVALAGVLFISLTGWRLIPRREAQASGKELFHIQDYIAEVRVPDGSPLVGRSLHELEVATEGNVVVGALVRGKRRLPAPSSAATLQSEDILVVEADPEALKEFLEAGRLELGGSTELEEDVLRSDEVGLVEAVIMPDALMVGQTARTLDLHWRYGVNLLAVARQGARVRDRLSRIRFQAGDVVLLQGEVGAVREALPVLGCLPLAERELGLGRPRRVLLSTAIFGAAVTAAALGLVSPEIVFVGAGIVMVLAGLLPLRRVYEAIDWPIIVLLGAMIPIGQALETSGGAVLIAGLLLEAAGQMPAAGILAILLVGTMLLSNVVNNAAAAVLTAPIALSVSGELGTSPDPFLMAVAVGASCAFLTPIGHQSNTLVLGPGGYRFGDYWRMGLPLSLIVTIAAILLIPWIWPLRLSPF